LGFKIKGLNSPAKVFYIVPLLVTKSSKERNKVFMPQCISRLMLFLSIALFSLIGNATPGINMPYGVSPISHEIYNLHMACFYVCCVIGVLVFGVLIFSLIKYRKSAGAKAAHFHEHLWVEIVWTTIPFLILVALAVPATIVLQDIHNTDKAALSIKITGYQWKWKYEYLDQGISFFSNLSTTQDQINNRAPKDKWFLLEVDHPVVVPINTKVKLLVTADDVIHAWWVPELGVKQDAIPGYINENWIYITKPGTYRGQCGELCGVNHGFMPIVVQAVTQAEFNQWVALHSKNNIIPAKPVTLKTLTEQELVTQGRVQYEKTCAMCHQNTGLGLPPSFPALKDNAIVTGPLQHNIDVVLHGVPGTAMQAFGEQLDDTTIAAILTYVRTSWGNDGVNMKNKNPTIVQAQDVEKAKIQP
jgi:cytochrome c oxidase subunit 2